MKREPSYLVEFGEDLQHYYELMAEAFEGVIREGVSKYPTFIFHKEEVSVGLPISHRGETAGNWSVNISTLEEFYIKGLVNIEQVEEMKKKISGPNPGYCCLVLSGEEGSLIFLNSTDDEEE